MDVATDAGAGRGARERLLDAAGRLFVERGINVTGVDELARTARVSKRSLYQHFGTKDDLVVAHLERLEGAVPGEEVLARVDLAPRERLLALFGPATGDGDAPVRGCPYVNAAVEVADPDHPVHRAAVAHKRAFRGRLADVAAEAGLTRPDDVACELAVVFDGLVAHAVVAGTVEPGVAAAARRAAARAIDAAA